MGKIEFDFETRSYADLKKVGVWAYSEDPTTDIICCAYDTGDGQGVRSWWPGKEGPMHNGMPVDLHDSIAAGAHVEAHNVAFEYSVWHNVMVRKYGWIAPAEDAWSDTMAVACYYALPAALDKLARVLGFGGKDPEGDRLITKYSKLHLKTAKLEIPPEDFAKFVKYCERDVAIEQSVGDFLGPLPDRELPAFLLDQKVNRRGLYLDAAGIEQAAKIADGVSDKLTAEFRGITGGISHTQTAKFKDWLKQNGVDLPDLRAETIEEVLEDGISTEFSSEVKLPLGAGSPRRTLEIRLFINKASTKKLDAMARQRDSRGRARYQSRYHGAQTGRDTGSGFQPLNLVRSWDKVDPESLVKNIMHGDAWWLDQVYGDRGGAMEAIKRAGRHWIMAEEGNRVMAGDFVSIEAVVLACLAGEDWKVETFARGDPVYEVMACEIHNLGDDALALARANKDAFKEKYPHERQDGKTGELAFGYQGALNAWLNFDSSGRHSDERIIEICRAWRKKHPAIVAFWRGLEKASLEAVQFPGRETSYRDIGFVVDTVGEFRQLAMVLPDGKHIWYWDPQIRVGMPKWHDPEVNEDCAEGTCGCKPQPKLTYMAQKFGQWRRVYTYGGKLAENATQATSRQILNPSAFALEDSGYPIILKVYDELVAEVGKSFGTKQEFETIMRQSAGGSWSRGWPINVDVWVGRRYKK